MNPARRTFAWMIGLVVVLKLAAVLIDPQMRLFLGDSATFLLAARVDDWLPPDRSFVYPNLIRWMVLPTGSLGVLLYWQTLAGIVTALLMGWILRARLDLPRTLTLVVVCVFALAPEQLFYERMVLAETFGLCAFVAFFAAASAYLVRGAVIWLPITLVLGLAAVSLRMNYAPVVIVISLGLPLLRLFDADARPPWRVPLAHCLVALACFALTHGAYRDYVGQRFETEPGYIGSTGFMRMGLVAPLIKPADFVRAGLPADFAKRLTFDLADPDTRPAQLWTAGGLADAIAKEGLDVDATCRKLSDHAFRDDPFGLVRLGVYTLGGYFDHANARMRLTKDLARNPSPYPDKVIADVRDHWHYDIGGAAQRWTPVSRWFSAGSSWLVACLFLLLPLGIANVIVHWRDPRRVQCLLGALIGAGLVSTEVLFSSIASYRYLHAFPLFMLVNALPLAVTLWRRVAARVPVEPLPA